MLKEYRTIIKSQAVWIVVITLLWLGVAFFAGYVGGQNSQFKIRIEEKKSMVKKLYRLMDSVNVHYLDMERNGCFNLRVRNGE